MSANERAASAELALYVADTSLAAGLQYGLWVERAPSTEEQVALSSMSQDKLGHARAFYQEAADATGRSTVELQYDRGVDEFAWNPAWTVELDAWADVVLAQGLFGPALGLDLHALSDDTALSGPLAKIDQEDRWHERHAEAWLEVLAEDPGKAQASLDELWPYAVGFFGPEDAERFPEDLEAGVRTRSDDGLREDYLDDLVPRLEAAGLDVDAERTGDGWATKPRPSSDLVDGLRERALDHATELVGLLQDPDARELAELA